MRFWWLIPLAAAAVILVAISDEAKVSARDPDDLQKGDRGEKVTQLQERLAAHGHNPGPIDGIFGVRTEGAVKAFQAAQSLPATGIVDAATRAVL